MSNVYATAPASGGADITKNDSTILDSRTRAVWVSVAGDLKVTTWDGSVMTFGNVPVGFHVVRAKIVWSTGTTATVTNAVW
jgi:hypothetical protein